MVQYFPIDGYQCDVDGCGSRRFYVDNGLTYCREGHHQEGRVEQVLEFEDFNPSQGQTSRIARDKREKIFRGWFVSYHILLDDAAQFTELLSRSLS